jgi:hypothetical protein
MSNYQSVDDPSQGVPNLGFMQYLQENWGKEEIESALRIDKISVTASGSTGIASATIPVGAEIIDVIVHPTSTNGGGTAQLKVGDGGAAITDAIACAVLDTIGKASTIDQDYKVVGTDGIEVVTNSDSDTCDVYVQYKK